MKIKLRRSQKLQNSASKQSGNAMVFILMATVAGASLVVWQGKQMVVERKHDAAILAARQLAQVTETLAGRIAELEGNFTATYAAGAPTTDLRWLKDPANCSLAGIPPKPNRPDGSPIVESFLPCDFPDFNESGNPYVISWTGAWPNLIATVNVGDPALPFTFQGDVNGRYGGLIASKANAVTEGGREDGMHRIYVSYQYNPDSDTLAGIADNTAPVPIRPEVDPHSLYRDGSTAMGAAARIRWEGSTVWVGQVANRAWLEGTDATVRAKNDLRVEGGQVSVTANNGNAVVEASGATTIYGGTGLSLRTGSQSHPVDVNVGLTAHGAIRSTTGAIISDSSYVQGRYFYPSMAVASGSSCTGYAVGAIARSTAGAVVSCSDGTWSSPGGAVFHKASPGYYRDPSNGFLMQWGETTNMADDTNRTVYFPVAFTKILNASVSIRSPGGRKTNDDVFGRIISKNNTSMVVRAETTNSATLASSRYIEWFVIGY